MSDEFHPITGRRIVDINFLLEELQKKGSHSDLFDCKSNYFHLVGEKRLGLTSVFKFQCRMCKKICLIHSEDTNNTEQVNLNIAATTGIVASGIGYSQFEELCSSMDVPIFSPNYYNKLQNEVYEKWEKTASASMEAAAAKEKEIAIAEGRIENGYPVIDVYVDGSWCARSYGTNYKASSGTAAIIGRRTGQIIYMGVKNKYCLMCARADNKNVASKEHACFKNYQGSSSSMETEILLEGFKSSVSMYGLVYKKMIGDGDASTYEKILKAKPYEAQNITVEKIECRNHILRNFCKKMRALKTETKYALAHRKTLTNVKIMSMRKTIVKCIKHHNVSKSPRSVSISVLHNDIVNSLLHAYGDHKMCQSYYCDREENNSDELKIIQNSTFAFRINAIVSNVAMKSRSLIEDVDTNIVECFNSVIAKFIGGKRANFSLKQGYQSRCSAAVVSFNSKSAISSVQKEFTNKNSSGRIEEMERKRALKRKHFVQHPVKKKRILKEANKKQHDYGPSSSAPDMSHEDMEMAKEEFMKNLQSLTSNKKAIERGSILQRESSEWLEIRQKLITASNFGPVCKRKPLSNTANLVKSILYQKNLAHVASVAHGVENEKLALLQLQRQENVEILPCGLFIDSVHPFIGASPDGLIGQDIIVEIKCPFTVSKIGLAKSIEQNKIQILKYNKDTKTCTINKKCHWYYQIQGQLHVTGRQVCLLGIWASENEPLFTERIHKDDQFWYKHMEPRLVQFYFKCLLPELVDSRYKRGMPIRKLTLQDKENDHPLSSINNLEQPGPSSHKRGVPKRNLPLPAERNEQPSSPIQDFQEPGPITRVIDITEF
ncbi:uncharacterized protein LOC123665502 [Melitaea cinxia]|uniref:uncharacterized protein LOC123665502 n=1 Tax=Melitaea cinxia TaxID=113334 RepID=UPI001E26F9D6|nr:uncharacterized protein LOC123665502 [Melitaea cinxia]XP_045455751.1 uncharacterized protein LOC123665502 [Melitaea cinxia]